MARKGSNRAAFLITVLASLGLLAIGAGPAAGGVSWYEGAEGYRQAVERAESEGLPVFIYFYADWCPYCRELEATVLRESEVVDYLNSIAAVRVNPEHGPPENMLARGYRIRGYPALYVQLGTDLDSVRPLRRTVMDNGRPRLMTAGEFVSSVREAAGE